MFGRGDGQTVIPSEANNAPVCLPPEGANLGHRRNPRIDELTDQIRVEMDQEKRRALSSEVQKILAEDLPYLPVWFNDVSPSTAALSDPSILPPAAMISSLPHCIPT